MPTKFWIPPAVARLLLFALFFAGELSICLAQVSGKQAKDDADDPKNPLIPEFRRCDADGDGLLTEAEYCRRIGFSTQEMHREFIVFDADEDARLTLNEFLTVPVGQSDEHRGTITDPVIVLSKAKLAELVGSWNLWDKNNDGVISRNEFATAELNSRVKGLEWTAFADWDLNRDGNVSRDEVARVLDIAFGVCVPGGTMLRSGTGQVVDWAVFLRCKTNANGYVSREDYFQALGPTPNREDWFRTNDKNNDGKFDFVEFSTGGHRTNPVGDFLNMDVDLNGNVSRAELATLPEHWRQMARTGLRAFDDNRDGELSLREYQLMPHSNLVATWPSAFDTNNDGMLSVEEFQFHKGLPLAAITREYFRRLDRNTDQRLTRDEWLFNTNHPNPPGAVDNWEIYVRFADDTEKYLGIPGYAIVCSPEISPDAKWIAVDAWKTGQNNVAAHVFTVHVDTKEVRDHGIGCIPNWSADGRRLALSRYGRGVFIRDFEGASPREESIDSQGWAIMFAPDGLKTAYVKQGNLVVHTLKTGEKRFVIQRSPYTYIEHNFTWSPDSERICFKGHRADGTIDIGIISASGDDPKLKIRCDGRNVQSDFAWHSDGKRLMFPYNSPGAEFVQTFYLDVDGDDLPVRYPRQPQDRYTSGLCWSRDGMTFVVMCKP